MPLTLDEIHLLEVREDYPAAINALEDRVGADPSDSEAVIRLGFNLWYAVVEDMRMSLRSLHRPRLRRILDLIIR